MFGVACLWTAIRNVAPIELVTFGSKSGVPVFEVIKDSQQADGFEMFVAALKSRIRKPEPDAFRGSDNSACPQWLP